MTSCFIQMCRYFSDEVEASPVFSKPNDRHSPFTIVSSTLQRHHLHIYNLTQKKGFRSTSMTGTPKSKKRKAIMEDISSVAGMG
jgi:hypothetical protein